MTETAFELALLARAADCKDIISAHRIDPALARAAAVKMMLAEQPLRLVGFRVYGAGVRDQYRGPR